MLITDLYTGDFFYKDKYDPDFDASLVKVFANSNDVIKATQFVNLGDNNGKMGTKIEIVSNNGGDSKRRDFYSTVSPNVVGANYVTVLMANYGELVRKDLGAERTVGNADYVLQLESALSRLADTFVKRLFNADTDEIEDDGKKYMFNGWKKYFEINTSQVNNTPLNVANVVANYNAKMLATKFLKSVNAKIDVSGHQGEVIYTTSQGKAILTSLESDKQGYRGIYTLLNGIETFGGLPIVVIPDIAVPNTWKQKGEFVLFANQDPNFGARVLVPANGGLIKSYPDAYNGYQADTPIDMTFAPIQVHPKTASLCFLSENATGTP